MPIGGRIDSEKGWNEQWMPSCYFQRAFNLIHFAMQVQAVVAVVQYFFYSFSCVIEALLNQCTTNCTLFKPDIYNATLFHVDFISIIYPNCCFLSTLCFYAPTKFLNSLPIWLCWKVASILFLWTVLRHICQVVYDSFVFHFKVLLRLFNGKFIILFQKVNWYVGFVCLKQISSIWMTKANALKIYKENWRIVYPAQPSPVH